MKNILIIESNSPELLAQRNPDSRYFVRTLLEIDPTVQLRIAAPYARALSDADLDGVDGVVFTGSGVDWATDDPREAPLHAAMEMVFKHALPVWGSCNGMQLAAVVLGGKVGVSPNGKEFGLARALALTDAGRTHAMMAGREDDFCVPCVHRDEVTELPSGSQLLAGNAHTPIQAYSYEQGGVRFWGAQYHPEMTTADAAACMRSDGPLGGRQEMWDMLDRAGEDEAAATALGTSVSAQATNTRARELVNWLSSFG